MVFFALRMREIYILKTFYILAVTPNNKQNVAIDTNVVINNIIHHQSQHQQENNFHGQISSSLSTRGENTNVMIIILSFLYVTNY